jgi:limonene 1,2-monooxygenase
MEERSEQFGTDVDRRGWRLVGPMHIAETKEQAYEDVRFGLAPWVDYFQRVAALPLAPDTTDATELADAMNASGFAVIGTPDDAIAQIERLVEQSGGFGTFLVMAQDWADRPQTWRSYELMSRYVLPHFQGSAAAPTTSRDWAAENRPQFIGEATAAVMSAVQSHHEERAAAKG